ncbi:cytolytic toxin-alpha [Pangasianodon hypophthalmus]|uniref:cytolytic toxin-alpha n=1 Tax=Pangasianodon hypophthalmus TaxID=310915 RepID=UPI00230761AF|nr:cytolytic toxin-alpha [Pangasianodon hypophthalmus]
MEMLDYHASRCMVMAALGRPLYPGMLYDCRRDSFIPGVTLWDKKALRDDLDVHDQTKTFVKFTASDSLGEKANLLDISASLKASFLGGLVEVGGSAKYLHDTKSSARQCRVTMQYRQTTKFEQLTMKELGNITYPQVFDQQTATHVVTAVLYGAQAFMVFNYNSVENESKQAIEGSLHAMVKKIPTISIEGEASVKINEDEKKLAENISVTFYGDYELEENPTTYTEALRACKRLPTLLKERNNKGVPMTVWLYPLMLLDNKAAKLAREISLSLVHQTEKLLEELGEVERRCNDLNKNQTTDNFPDVKGRLLKFQDLHRSYKITFQKALSRVLPAIRGGTQEDKALGDILDIHYMSPFTASNMNKWLDDVTTEINILSSYTSGLKDLTVVKSSGSLHSILFDPDVDVVVCLSFTSLKNEDSYLLAIQDFINSERFANLGQKNAKAFSLQATQPWFTSPDISECMKKNFSLFTSFSKANKNEKKIKFVVASISDSSNPGNSIQLYQKGKLTDPKFQPVSKPPLPMVETNDEKVILKLSKSPTGETVRFRVEYRMTPPTDSAADTGEWKVTDTPDAQTSFTLTGLQPGDRYWFRYRAVSDGGVSEASDSVPFSFHGMLTITVGQWDFSMPSLFNKLRTKIMTSMGMSRWSLSTVNSEVTNVVNSPSIPYTDTIPGGLKTGMALYFQGVVFAAGESIRFNLIAGTEKGSDRTFHMRCDFNESMVYNSHRNGSWENEEITPGCPISKGSAFDIFFVTKTEGYEVYVNGQRHYLFKHRMPMEKVTTLNINGDVIMNITGIVPNWNASTFGKELNSGISRAKLSNIQSDVPHPVCNPSKPYLGSIPGGLRPGVALFFQGVVPSDCERFKINLQTGPKDIALHFNPRMNSVVLNSCRNGTWENYIETPGGPFVKGGAFDIIMAIKEEGYEVIVNGLEYCTFNHRMPVDKVTTLGIWGDVFMNNFGFTEVDDVNMKVIIPANI